MSVLGDAIEWLKGESDADRLVSLAARGDAARLRALLALGTVHVEARSKRGETALYAAAAGGHREAARALIALGADARARAVADDDPILNRAAAIGDVALCDLLMGLGADPNAESRSGMTPLMCAIEGRHVEAVKCLLARGAFVDQPMPPSGRWPGATALSLGAHLGASEVVALLYASGRRSYPSVPAMWGNVTPR